MRWRQGIGAASDVIAKWTKAGRARLSVLAPAISVARGIAAAVPVKIWLAAGALILAGLWLQEHDARVRSAAELRQVKQETAARVQNLEAQAEEASRAANDRNASTVAQLEAQRSRLERDSQDLNAHLQSLREKQQAKAAEISALPSDALFERLAEQLGPAAVVPGAAQMNARDHRSPLQQAAESSPLQLTEAGARSVASALAERDACRDENALQARLLANCQAQASTMQAEIRTQADSVSKLNQALDAKDKILAAREAEWKAELRAARVTWRGRAVRALKFIAVGVGIGVALR